MRMQIGSANTYAPVQFSTVLNSSWRQLY